MHGDIVVVVVVVIVVIVVVIPSSGVFERDAAAHNTPQIVFTKTTERLCATPMPLALDSSGIVGVQQKVIETQIEIVQRCRMSFVSLSNCQYLISN